VAKKRQPVKVAGLEGGRGEKRGAMPKFFNPGDFSSLSGPGAPAVRSSRVAAVTCALSGGVCRAAGAVGAAAAPRLPPAAPPRAGGTLPPPLHLLPASSPNIRGYSRARAARAMARGKYGKKTVECGYSHNAPTLAG